MSRFHSNHSVPNTVNGKHRVIWAIATGQLMFWASSFYVFHALLPRWEMTLGWSRIELTTGFTAALLSAAAFAPVAGLLIDRGWGRAAMITGGTVASVCLLLLSQVSQLNQFYLIWIVLGLCHATILYEPCFAILTRRFGMDAKRSITTVTLIAGFAGSVSFPTAHFLSSWLGWNYALWFFSLMCLIGTLISAFALSERTLGRAEPNAESETQSSLSARETTRSIVTSSTFWLTTISFSLIMLIHGSLLAHLIPLLLERDIEFGTAVLVISLVGPMQIVGRIAMLGLQHKLATDRIALVAFASVSLSCIVLLTSDSRLPLIILFVCLYGAGYGVTSISRPAVTAQFFGNRTFGTVSGIMSVPFTASFALAPALASLLWTRAGYSSVLVVSVILAFSAIILLAMAARQSRPGGGPST